MARQRTIIYGYEVTYFQGIHTVQLAISVLNTQKRKKLKKLANSAIIKKILNLKRKQQGEENFTRIERNEKKSIPKLEEYKYCIIKVSPMLK